MAIQDGYVCPGSPSGKPLEDADRPRTAEDAEAKKFREQNPQRYNEHVERDFKAYSAPKRRSQDAGLSAEEEVVSMAWPILAAMIGKKGKTVDVPMRNAEGVSGADGEEEDEAPPDRPHASNRGFDQS